MLLATSWRRAKTAWNTARIELINDAPMDASDESKLAIALAIELDMVCGE